MTLTQISEILNNSIVPAIMGDEFTVHPNLDNIVDLGTKISAMTAEQFKTYFNDFCAQVRTYTDPRGYSPEELPLFVDSQEYGGIVQSIKSDFTTTRDSHLYSLVDGTTYDDVNKYFGTSFDNKIYEKDSTYSIAKSIPNSMYKKAFLSADGVSQLVALIETWIMNTVRREASALEHNLLADLALNGVQINLVSTYNELVKNGDINTIISTYTGTSGDNTVDIDKTVAVSVTSTNCVYNPFFMQWAMETISNIVSAAKFANKKYNDGTVSTWLTKNDTIMIYNSVFKNRMNALNINADLDGASVYDTPFWNVQTDSLVPTISNSTKIVYSDDGTETTNKTLNNVIGMFYDRWAVGYTTTPIEPRTSYNADGDFYNQFRDFNNRYWIDTRNTAIVFTLN